MNINCVERGDFQEFRCLRGRHSMSRIEDGRRKFILMLFIVLSICRTLVASRLGPITVTEHTYKYVFLGEVQTDPRQRSENLIQDVGFEVLTAVVMKSSVFWDIMPCSPLKLYRRFGGTCRLHLQRRRICQARSQRVAIRTNFLLSLLFDFEDGGDMFLRNVGTISTEYTALYPRRWFSS
jgi:hypothetical protein